MKEDRSKWVRLLMQTSHYGTRPLYVNPDLVAAVQKDQDGRTLVSVAGTNTRVEAPGLREQMCVGQKGGTREPDFNPVNFVKVSELLGVQVAKADRPVEAATKPEPEDIKEPGDPKK